MEVLNSVVALVRKDFPLSFPAESVCLVTRSHIEKS